MAKTPGPPKAKTAAPAQFDMNARDRKGGGKGGPGRNRDEKRPPARVVALPPVQVDRGEGWVIRKIGKIDQASHAPVGAEYHLIFEGHDPLVFEFLGAARTRAKEPPPELPQAAEAAAEPAESAEAAEEAEPTEAAAPAEEA
jgi:hypothetical protein